MKKSAIEKCPHCKSDRFVRNGTHKGVQKYKCSNPECKKIFRDKNYLLKNKAAKNLILALLNIIEAKIEPTDNLYIDEYDILSLMQSGTIDEERLEKISFAVKSLRHSETFGAQKNVNCYNPAVILCQVGDEIRIIKLPRHDFPQYYNASEPEKNKREIHLINKPDQELFKNGKKIIKKS